MSADIPDIDDCCEKETYAFYGLAAYLAQVLEHSALNLALILRFPAVDAMSKEVFDGLFESLSKKTFGHLLRIGRPYFSVSESDVKALDEALDLRNFLVHEYFRVNAENFVSAVGQREMKQELQGIIGKLLIADTILENLYEPLWERYGVTKEFIDRELEEMQARVASRDRHNA